MRRASQRHERRRSSWRRTGLCGHVASLTNCHWWLGAPPIRGGTCVPVEPKPAMRFVRGWDFKNPITMIWGTVGVALGALVWATQGWSSGGWYLAQSIGLALLAASP